LLFVEVEEREQGGSLSFEESWRHLNRL
jgi:hypothetical protein